MSHTNVHGVATPLHRPYLTTEHRGVFRKFTEKARHANLAMTIFADDIFIFTVTAQIIEQHAAYALGFQDKICISYLAPALTWLKWWITGKVKPYRARLNSVTIVVSE